MPPFGWCFRPADGYLMTEEFLRFDGSIELGRFIMKKFLIAVVGTALAFGPALYAQDVVTGVKDASKDVAHGTKKAADKTASHSPKHNLRSYADGVSGKHFARKPQR